MNAPCVKVLPLPDAPPCPRWRFPSAFPLAVRYAEVTKAQVAQAFGLTVDELLATGRHTRAAWARQVAMYLVLELTGESTDRVAHLFHREDHGTACHARKIVRGMMRAHPDLDAEIEELKRKIVREVTRNSD